MKISKTTLSNSIFFINPLLAKIPAPMPELLKMVAVDIVVGQEEHCNRSSFEYGVSKHYIAEALKEISEKGFLEYGKELHHDIPTTLATTPG